MDGHREGVVKRNEEREGRYGQEGLIHATALKFWIGYSVVSRAKDSKSLIEIAEPHRDMFSSWYFTHGNQLDEE